MMSSRMTGLEARWTDPAANLMPVPAPDRKGVCSANVGFQPSVFLPSPQCFIPLDDSVI